MLTEDSADPPAGLQVRRLPHPLPIEELARRHGVKSIYRYKRMVPIAAYDSQSEAGGFYEILERNRREAREAERKASARTDV